MTKSGKFTVGKDLGGRWHVNISAKLSDTGKRQKIYFDTKKKAEAERDRLRIDQHNHGSEAVRLPLSLRMDAQKAAAMLAPHSAGLVDAAQFYLDHRASIARSSTFPEALEAYLAEKGSDLGEGSQKQYAAILKRYTPAFDGKKLEEITVADVSKAVSWTKTKATRNAHLRYLNTIWKRAVIHKRCSENVIAQVVRRKQEEIETRAFTADEAEKLMRAAEAYEGGKFAGYYAVCLFAGLRPKYEACGIKWGDIREKIVLPAKVSKTGKKRLIDIGDNLAAWIAKHRGAAGETVSPCGYMINVHKEARAAIRKAAGVDWQRDITRHSYCTHHLAEHGDIGELCRMTGHSVGVSMKHYQGDADPVDAAKFWAINPG